MICKTPQYLIENSRKKNISNVEFDVGNKRKLFDEEVKQQKGKFHRFIKRVAAIKF